MYAIVKTGGKQYRVQTGQRLLVERLAAEAGAEVALQPILYRDSETVLDPAGLRDRESGAGQTESALAGQTESGLAGQTESGRAGGRQTGAESKTETESA